jgi:hypothetical protein
MSRYSGIAGRVRAEPVLFLCSDEALEVNDQRIIAKEFTHSERI